MTFEQFLGTLVVCAVVNAAIAWVYRRQENNLRALMRDALSDQIEALELVQPILADMARLDPTIEEPVEVARLQVKHQLERMRVAYHAFAERAGLWRSLRRVSEMRAVEKRQRRERNGEDGS